MGVQGLVSHGDVSQGVSIPEEEGIGMGDGYLSLAMGPGIPTLWTWGLGYPSDIDT